MSTSVSFWDIKHQTDALAAQLGWSKEYCKFFVQARYDCRSRLVMTDEQLLDLLAYLKKRASELPNPERDRKLKRKKRKRR